MPIPGCRGRPRAGVRPHHLLGLLALAVATHPAYAAKPCDEIKGEIAAKIDANHVPDYTLESVAAEQVGERTVVGSCDGGSKRIVYTRGGAQSTAADGSGAAAATIGAAPASSAARPPAPAPVAAPLSPAPKN